MFTYTVVSPRKSSDPRSTHLCLIKSQRNDRIPTPLQTLPNHPLNRRISRRVHQIREIPDLAPYDRFQERANVGTPIARADGDSIDRTENLDDAIPWNVVHGGCYDSISIREAAGRSIHQFCCFVVDLRVGLG